MVDQVKRFKGVHQKNGLNQNHTANNQDLYNRLFLLILDIEKQENLHHRYHHTVDKKDALIINTSRDRQEV